MAKSKPPLKFKSGGLHKSMGIKPGKKMTAAQHEKAAKSSNPLEKKQETFFENVLSKGHKKGKK